MEAFAYLRDSGGREQEQSVGQQRAAIAEWARAQRVAIVAWYEDAARPGSSVDNREQFLRLIDAACVKPAPVAAVVVWDFARFSRNEIDRGLYGALLAKHGVRLISVTQDIPENAAAGIMREVVAFSDAEYLRALSVNVKRGLHSAAQLGRHHGRCAPVGYTRTLVEVGTHRDGTPRTVQRWQIDAALVPRVREAFRLYTTGASAQEIHAATGLATNYDGYRTILTNPVYAGIVTLGGVEYRDESLRIIDDATWAAACARRRQRIPPRTVSSRYLLSGLLVCGMCGRSMYGRTMHSGGSAAAATWYFCRNAVHLERDARCSVRAHCVAVDAAVWETVMGRLAAGSVDAYVAELRERAERGGSFERAQRLAQDIRRAEAGISNLVELAAGASVALAELRSRLAVREAELAELRAQLAAIPPDAKQPFDAAAVRARLLQLRDDLERGDVAQRRRALTLLVERVVYHPTDGVNIVYRASI